MAFPRVESAAVTEFFGGATTSHNVLVPATVAPGDLLLAMVFNTGTSTITATGWTEIRTRTTSDNSARLSVLAKVAVGNEGGTTVNFETSSAAFAIVHLYRISGWFGDIAGVEAFMLPGTGTTPNPPLLTPSWGFADTLWLAVGAAAVGAAAGTVTAAPSGFTDFLSGPSQLMGSARRELAADSINPALFAGSPSAQWVAATIGVRPGAGLIPVEGSGDAALPPLTAQGAGAALIEGVGESALPPVAAAGAGTVQDLPVDGAGQVAVPAVTAEGVGAVEATGAGQVAVPPVTAAGAGGVEIAAAGAAQVPAVRASGAGTVTSGITGSGAVTLPPVETSGVGTVEVAGSGSAILPAVAGDGIVTVTVAGDGATQLPAIAGTGVATVEIVGSGGATLPAIVGAGIATTGDAFDLHVEVDRMYTRYTVDRMYTRYTVGSPRRT